MGVNLSNLYLNRDNFGMDWIPFYTSLVDYNLIDLVFVLVFGLFDLLYLEKRGAPFQRQFTINDITISHPFAEVERVSAEALLRIAIIVPTFFLFITNLFLTPKKHKVYVMYISMVGLLVSITTDIFITDILKNWIGRCRPDFLARCKPNLAIAVPDVLYTAKEICTETDMDLLLDGFRTTPSGHSSISFASLGYTSIWLMGQLKAYHNSGGGAWRTLVSLGPSLLASYIALSRTQDYRHHFIDVILGSTLGFLAAWWSYRRLFPSIVNENCYVPYRYLNMAALKENSMASLSGYNQEFYETRNSMGGDYMMTPQHDLESGQTSVN